jgi:hypothetical protein
MKEVDESREDDIAKGPFHSLKTRLDALPPSICGAVLGSVGLAGILRLIGKIYNLSLDAAAIPLYLLSGLYAIAMLIRIGCNPKACAAELSEPASASPYGAFAISLALLFDTVASLTTSSNADNEGNKALWWIGTVGIYLAATIQLVVMLIFFRACWIHSSPPEPLWFPPTVSLAIIGWTGVTVGMPRVLVELSFWGGIILTIILLPIATLRVVWQPHQVAANPTVAMLQAPASFMTVAWFEIGGSQWLDDKANDVLVTILFATSTAIFLVTLASTIRRFKYICGVGFSHVWVSFTFPSISTTRAALLFMEHYTSAGSVTSNVLPVWSIVLSVALLPGVLVVLLWYTVLAVFRPEKLLVTAPPIQGAIIEDGSTSFQNLGLSDNAAQSGKRGSPKEDDGNLQQR